MTPVFVGGTTVRNATLHNIEEIQRRDLRVGDTIVLQRAGDVIPEVVSAVTDARDGTEIPWEMPTACPVCGTDAVREEGEVVWRCPNPWCPAQRIGGLLHFTGRGGFDIEGAGYAVVNQLAEKGLLNEPADLFRLDVETLEGLDRYARKSAENLHAAIQGARRRPLARIINSLGIRHVGFQTAIDLANWLTAETPRAEDESEADWTRRVADRLRGASAEELTAVFGIGQVVAEGIAAYFADEHTAGTLHALIEAGVDAPRRRSLGPRSPSRAPGRWLASRWSSPARCRASAARRRRRRSGRLVGMPADRFETDRLPRCRRQGRQQAGQGGEARCAGPGRGWLPTPAWRTEHE